MNKLYDLFLTHAWRYHDDWIRMGEMLDACEGLRWRNFSVPWHDPAMDPNTEVGGKFIRHWLESQIIPVTAVILLNSVYETNSSRKWVDFEIEAARRHNKRVIAVPTYGQPDVLPEVRAMSDVVVPWDCQALIAAIDAVSVQQG
jgi:hypothetical protein